MKWLSPGKTSIPSLFISQGTVNTHLTRIYKKLGVHSRQNLLDVIENDL